MNSGYWNPAGLTGVDKWLEVGLMHSEYFAGIAKYDYLGLAHSIDDKSSVGFTAIRFAVDDIPNTTQLIDNNGNIDYDRITTFTAADYGFLFSYARKLPVEGLSVGGNFKIVHRKIGSFAKSWGFGLDAGAQYGSLTIDNVNCALPQGAPCNVNGELPSYKFSVANFTGDCACISTSCNDIVDIRQTGENELTFVSENGLELTLPRLILAGYKKFDLGKKGIYASGELDLDITTDGKRNTILKVISIKAFM